MKLLLVTLCVIIAVNGNSAAPTDSLSQADIKKIGEEVLKEVKTVKEEVGQIRDAVRHAISSKLKQIPEVKKVEEQYIEGLSREDKISVECAISVDQQYLETLETVTELILKKTLKNVTDDEDYLNTAQKKVDELITSLTQNLDEDVKKCADDAENCSITGKFIEATEGLFKLVNLESHKILDHAENEVSSEEVQEIVKKYVANVPKCLTGEK